MASCHVGLVSDTPKEIKELSLSAYISANLN